MENLPLFFVIFVQVTAACFAQHWGNNYRIEVLFTRFDSGGIIHNGKRCDVFTVCDPVLYSYVDIDLPMATYPGAARSINDFQKFMDERAKNQFLLSARISKNLCRKGRLPQNVNVRVEAYDYDYFTKQDLIDKFECVFPFAPTSRDEMRWSLSSSCRPLYQPVKHSLSYRWRIVPIQPQECGSSEPLIPIPTTLAPQSPMVRFLTSSATSRPVTTTTTTTTARAFPRLVLYPLTATTARTTTTPTPRTTILTSTPPRTTTTTTRTPETSMEATADRRYTNWSHFTRPEPTRYEPTTPRPGIGTVRTTHRPKYMETSIIYPGPSQQRPMSQQEYHLPDATTTPRPPSQADRIKTDRQPSEPTAPLPTVRVPAGEEYYVTDPSAVYYLPRSRNVYENTTPRSLRYTVEPPTELTPSPSTPESMPDANHYPTDPNAIYHRPRDRSPHGYTPRRVLWDPVDTHTERQLPEKKPNSPPGEEFHATHGGVPYYPSRDLNRQMYTTPSSVWRTREAFTEGRLTNTIPIPPSARPYYRLYTTPFPRLPTRDAGSQGRYIRPMSSDRFASTARQRSYPTMFAPYRPDTVTTIAGQEWRRPIASTASPEYVPRWRATAAPRLHDFTTQAMWYTGAAWRPHQLTTSIGRRTAKPYYRETATAPSRPWTRTRVWSPLATTTAITTEIPLWAFPSLPLVPEVAVTSTPVLYTRNLPVLQSESPPEASIDLYTNFPFASETHFVPTMRSSERTVHLERTTTVELRSIDVGQNAPSTSAITMTARTTTGATAVSSVPTSAVLQITRVPESNTAVVRTTFAATDTVRPSTSAIASSVITYDVTNTASVTISGTALPILTSAATTAKRSAASTSAVPVPTSAVTTTTSTTSTRSAPLTTVPATETVVAVSTATKELTPWLNNRLTTATPLATFITTTPGTKAESTTDYRGTSSSTNTFTKMAAALITIHTVTSPRRVTQDLSVPTSVLPKTDTATTPVANADPATSTQRGPLPDSTNNSILTTSVDFSRSATDLVGDRDVAETSATQKTSTTGSSSLPIDSPATMFTKMASSSIARTATQVATTTNSANTDTSPSEKLVTEIPEEVSPRAATTTLVAFSPKTTVDFIWQSTTDSYDGSSKNHSDTDLSESYDIYDTITKREDLELEIN